MTAAMDSASSRPGTASITSVMRMMTRVDPAAERAGEQTEGGTDGGADGQRDHTDDQRGAGAVEDAREHVAPALVEARASARREGPGTDDGRIWSNQVVARGS